MIPCERNRMIKILRYSLVILYACAVLFEAVAMFAFIDISINIMDNPCNSSSSHHHGVNLIIHRGEQFPFRCSPRDLGHQYEDQHHPHTHYRFLYRTGRLNTQDDIFKLGTLLSLNHSTRPKIKNDEHDAGGQIENDDLDETVQTKNGDLLLRSSFKMEVYNVITREMGNYFCNMYLCAEDPKSEPEEETVSSEESTDNRKNVEKGYAIHSSTNEENDKETTHGNPDDKINKTVRNLLPLNSLFKNSAGETASHLVPYSFHKENGDLSTTPKADTTDSNDENGNATDLDKVRFTFRMRDTTLNVFCQKRNDNQPLVDLEEHHSNSDSKSKTESPALNAIKYSLNSEDVENITFPTLGTKTHLTTAKNDHTTEVRNKTDFTLNENSLVGENSSSSITGKSNDTMRANVTEENLEENIMPSTTSGKDILPKKSIDFTSDNLNASSTTSATEEREGDTVDQPSVSDKDGAENLQSVHGDKLQGHVKAKDTHRNLDGSHDMDTGSGLSWLWSVLGAIFTGRGGQDRGGDVTESILGVMESTLSGNETLPTDWGIDSNDDDDNEYNYVQDGRIPYNISGCEAEEFFLSKLAIYLHVFGILASIFCTILGYKILVQRQRHPLFITLATVAAAILGFLSVVLWSLATYKKSDETWAFWPYIGCYFYILVTAICILFYNCYYPNERGRGSGPWQNIEAGLPSDQTPASTSGTSSGSHDNNGGGSSLGNAAKQSLPQSSSTSPKGAVGGVEEGGYAHRGDTSEADARRKPPLKETTPLLAPPKATPTDTKAATPTTPHLVKLAKNTPLPEVTADESTPIKSGVTGGEKVDTDGGSHTANVGKRADDPPPVRNGVAGGGKVRSADDQSNTSKRADDARPLTNGVAGGGKVIPVDVPRNAQTGKERDYINETMSLLHAALSPLPDSSDIQDSAKADEATPLMNGLDHDLNSTEVTSNHDTSVNIDSVD